MSLFSWLSRLFRLFDPSSTANPAPDQPGKGGEPAPTGPRPASVEDEQPLGEVPPAGTFGTLGDLATTLRHPAETAELSFSQIDTSESGDAPGTIRRWVCDLCGRHVAKAGSPQASYQLADHRLEHRRRGDL